MKEFRRPYQNCRQNQHFICLMASLVRPNGYSHCWFCRPRSYIPLAVAYDPIPTCLGEPNLQNAIDARMKEAESVLEQALALVEEIPGEVRAEILEGPAADAILRMAETWGSDLIVMGACGRGRLPACCWAASRRKW